ncbi:MAG TPA: hypothetical protein VMM76_19550 [Pirellulaceae bacterium]|nr:hypothetical protein [Pirellulaceae bacterium]
MAPSTAPRSKCSAPNSKARLSNAGPSRRRFLAQTAGLSSVLLANHEALSQAKTPRPKVAAIFTVLRFRSHAYNLLENFLGPYYFNGELTDPGVDVVAFYADQFPADDMAREVSQRFNIPLFESIDAALCLGGKRLAVDGVLSIAEHGDYPFNERGQHMYPRKSFFDQAVAVMKRSDRYVPYFNDKHLSYRWDWAREMYDTARAHGIPLMAGSSVPLAQRMPPLQLPPGGVIEEAVSIHGGGLESYDFHGLEVLQSIVESRPGGETGIARVQLLIGEEFEQARAQGRWSSDLVESAMQAEERMNVKRQVKPTLGVFAAPTAQPATQQRSRPTGPHAIEVVYKDGLKATVLKLSSSSDRWNFACRVRGESEPRATAFFNSPWGNRGLFKALSHAIQHLFVHGAEPYPAERTLLTTGATEAVMRSYEAGGEPIETPHLQIAYQANDWTAMRELGQTWNIITADTPQPTEFAPRPFTELKRR